MTISRGSIAGILCFDAVVKGNAIVRCDLVVIRATRPVVDHAAFVSTDGTRTRIITQRSAGDSYAHRENEDE